MDLSQSSGTMRLDEEERTARIAIASTHGVGPAKFFRLLENFGSAKDVFRASDTELRALVGPATARLLEPSGAFRKATKRIDKTRQVDGTIIVWGDPAYPARLKRMPRPPAILFMAGRLHGPGKTVGIVGRRAATGKGQAKAEEIASALALEDVSVISGGAYGIDASAHKGCLDANGHTICVLGSSLDRPYPQRHFRLFSKIAETGALLSIFPPGSEPRRANFIRRNAVIAALCDLLVVVEAGARSGARSTAVRAAGMGIPVAAVPGSIGTNRLLAEGAVSVDSPQAVLALLRYGISHRPTDPLRDPMSNISLTADSRRLLDVLTRGRGRTVGFLAWQTGLPMGRLAAALVELRLAGLAEQTPGGRWFLVTDWIETGRDRDKGEDREHDETGSGRIPGQSTHNREVPGS